MTSVWNLDPRSHGEHKIWSEEESRDQILCNNDLISEGLPKILVLGSKQSQGSFVLFFLQFSEHKVNAKHMVGSLSPMKINYMLSGMHQTHDDTRSRNQWSCSSSLDSCLFFDFSISCMLGSRTDQTKINVVLQRKHCVKSEPPSFADNIFQFL